jgi:hypothetical protein
MSNEYFSALERSTQETVRTLTDANKNAIREDLRKELASKEDVLMVRKDIDLVKKDIDLVKIELQSKVDKLDAKIDKVKTELDAKMDKVKIELDAKIDKTRVELEAKIDRLDTKFNFVIALLIIALTLMNPVVAAMITKALKLG